MAKKLERDLGLYSVITISIGAMIGSGIFVLPALAAKLAGPAVVLAYFLAGLIVLPAALSKAEMATAMPESGGTYLYVDRGMGPLMGTIAGIGTWFSLVFKSSFALVGLGAYLILFVNLPTTPVALGLAALLIVVNMVGVKQTGRLQAFLVTIVLLIIAAYAATGLTHIESDYLHPFFEKGSAGLFAATGFVFVSYAGVTKIASIAEEIENPGRNIPIGIIGSIVVMMVLYSLVVLVTVGVATPEDLGIAGHVSKGGGGKYLTPIAIAADNFLGEWAMVVVAVTAVLALSSMANAGILSSSRYPLAMSRDELAPKTFSEISDRFGTPVAAILLTGMLVLGLVAFVPVMELAKLASAFKICVFSIVNVALIAFRESDLEWYDPDFKSPWYPWLQLFGLIAGALLLTQMGMTAWLGALSILVVSVVWFAFYGRDKVEREGAAVDAIRRTAKEMVIDLTRDSIEGEEYKVLIPMGQEVDADREEQLLKLANSIISRRPAKIMVVKFDEVPEQTFLSAAPDETQEDATFDKVTGRLADEVDVPVEVAHVVSHNTRRALVNFAEEEHVDIVLANWEESFLRREMPGSDLRWVMKHTPCDVLFVDNRGFDEIEKIAVVADRETYSTLQIKIAKAMALALDAELELLYAIGPQKGPKAREQSAEEYLEKISDVAQIPMGYRILQAEDRAQALLDAIEDADLVITRESSDHLVLGDVVFGHIPDEIAENAHCTTLLPYEKQTRTHTFLRYILEKIIY